MKITALWWKTPRKTHDEIKNRPITAKRPAQNAEEKMNPSEMATQVAFYLTNLVFRKVEVLRKAVGAKSYNRRWKRLSKR